MRKRFRGNQPVALMRDLDGPDVGEKGGQSGGQLYAGRPAFGTVEGTDGKGEEGGKRE